MRRLFSLALILAMLNSCTYWAAANGPLDRTLSPTNEAAPSLIRVWLRDSSLVELRRPRIDSSAITGVAKGNPQSTIVIPRGSISRVAIQKNNGVFDALVLGALVGGAVAIAKAVSPRPKKRTGDGSPPIITGCLIPQICD